MRRLAANLDPRAPWCFSATDERSAPTHVWKMALRPVVAHCASTAPSGSGSSAVMWFRVRSVRLLPGSSSSPVKNKVAPPLRPCEIRLDYGRGFAIQHWSPAITSRGMLLARSRRAIAETQIRTTLSGLDQRCAHVNLIHSGGAIPSPPRSSQPAGIESCVAGGNECDEAWTERPTGRNESEAIQPRNQSTAEADRVFEREGQQ
jgi:hypothetical protein